MSALALASRLPSGLNATLSTSAVSAGQCQRRPHGAVMERHTGQPLGDPFTGHTDTVYSVAFSPDGHRLASASADQTYASGTPAPDNRLAHR